MAETWDRRIRRAEELTVGGGPESPLLAFYARLLQSQKAVYESLKNRGPSGSIEDDVLQIASRQRALNSAPGTQWSYTNTGYNLAAIIVSRVSGTTS